RPLRPDLPEALLAVLDKLLAKNPADRYGTPAEVGQALQPFTAAAADTMPERRPPDKETGRQEEKETGRGSRWRRLRVPLVWSALAGLVVLVAAWKLGWLSGTPSSGPDNSPATEPLRIVSLRIGHYRGRVAHFEGDIGVTS